MHLSALSEEIEEDETVLRQKERVRQASMVEGLQLAEDRFELLSQRRKSRRS
jgi:hypothetical protein